jgi:nitrite reductase/ring-hydroxylating ferredoxin subunit
MEDTLQFVKVAEVDEVEPGKMKVCQIGDSSIILVNLDGIYFAIDETCPHRSAPLSEGEISGDVIICPWHASEFDIRTGKNVAGPATEAIKSYAVRVDGDDVKVALG